MADGRDPMGAIELQPRDGFLLVSLVWTVLPAFATIPLMLYIEGLTFTDAYFETIAGLTTTGATILSGLDKLPPSINFWRCELQWLGGMGIIVLAVAILPLLGVGGSQIMRAETPGPMKETKLTPRITETAKGPMGEMTDRTTLDKQSLVVRKRSMSQGSMMNVDLEMKDGKATGEMKMGGQSRPISSELPGDIFADGAGWADVIATLPLAEGYSTTFRNLDVRTFEAKAMELKVVGSEQVTVPAGTFDAFKVEVSGADGARTTTWIARYPVRWGFVT